MHYGKSLVHGKAECQKIIDIANTIGFEESPVRSGASESMRKDIRNNSRAIVTLSNEFIENLERALVSRDIIPMVYKGMKYSRLNEVFRVYKYTDGQYFKPHKDGSIDLGDEETRLTVLMYLNTCDSGATYIYPYGVSQPWAKSKTRCERGTVIVFDHDLWHEGEPVVAETKYVLRTDVFYFKN